MTAQQKFELGDVVYHKSNPQIKLVVIDLFTDDSGQSRVTVRWMDNGQKINRIDLYEYEINKEEEAEISSYPVSY
ncbi:MAG TPA: hypothetical protein DCE41_27350 [Cytophagales bacterium]|nr:hypothetical protein [Cytophagales bacterium]HAA22644.1 hypothetical protein [Cytophagales bacterium]HAP62232.1 hypothetical protein [Cytophagales bacterium]